MISNNSDINALNGAKVSKVLCVFISLFAISSWIDINGVFVQLPLLVKELPESWSLPSYLTVIIQIANIGPVLFIVLKKTSKGYVSETPAIYIIIICGALSCGFLAIFWNKTAVIFGVKHSVALMVLVFFLAFVDCTSSVTFLPFMACYPSAYLTALYVGEGLSGLLPGVFALIQGSGGAYTCQNVSNDNESGWHMVPKYPEPNYSVSAFFWLLCAMLCISFASFLLMNLHPQLSKFKLPSFDGNQSLPHSAVPSTDPLVEESVLLQVPNATLSSYSIILFFIVLWVNFLSNGLLPSLQSYSTLPYGNFIYHLTVTLSSIVNPFASFASFWIIPDSSYPLHFLSIVGSLLATLVILTAVYSPNPPMVDNFAGAFLIILIWVLMIAIFSYLKVVIARKLRPFGTIALFWCGAMTQIGSAIGALTSFVLISQNIFREKSLC